jgi:hypothetical protein
MDRSEYVGYSNLLFVAWADKDEVCRFFYI